MCGIAGIIQKTGARTEKSDLIRMLRVQAHRGPDASGIVLTNQERVGFGHVRLSIIDLATGAQPLWSTDQKVLITFNGEIYDHLDHMKRLEADGLRFRTRSDTEVIVNLYRRHGLDFFSHLNGEFSFALWDETQRVFLAARDRYGVKPFFYRQTNEEILFSSEAKGLLALPRIPRDFSSDHIMTSLVSAPLQAVSPFAGIRALKPGHFLKWEPTQGEARELEYWRPRYEKGSHMPHAEAVERTRDVFRRTVKRRMVADVPVCSFLSGGLDSTLVTAEMARLRAANEVTAFTIGFSNSEYDESGPATEIAREIGVKHETLPVTMPDIAENLEHCIEHTELHVANPSAVGKFLLSKHVRDRGFKVALTGEGSDELFAGYAYFKLEQIWRRLESPEANIRKSGKVLLKRFRAMEKRSEGLLWNRTRIWKSAPRPFGFPSYIFTRVHEFGVLMPKFIHLDRYGIELGRGDGPGERLAADFANAGLTELDPTHASLYLSRAQLAGYVIPILGDRVEMAHSIEGRTPFLDVELAELTFQVPAAYLLDLDTLREKKLLHDALGDLLPPSAKSTRKHPFFSPNWRALERTPKGRELFGDYLSSQALDRVGLFQKPFMKRVLLLWRILPSSSSLQRLLDVLIGIVLTTQILHERLLRNGPPLSRTPLRGE